MSCTERPSALVLTAALAGCILCARVAAAQEAPPTRTAAIEQAQAAKATALHPYVPTKAEAIVDHLEDMFLGGRVHLHPFFESAYAGGGFTLGAGYARHVSAYNVVDVRGSITFSGYTRVEAAFLAPRIFNRRGTLTMVGGWRKATAVGFYGMGNANTSSDDRANYSFEQPYGAATIDLWPTRKLLVLHGGLELSRWNQGTGSDGSPSVDEIYTAETLPGLGAHPTYLHSEAGVGLDTRPSAGYARRGGYYGVMFHDFRDQDGRFGFRRTDYEAIQHVPILRETWVLSLHGRVELANAAGDQTIPFFMLPALGGGSSLRGYPSWRFRDRNSLLLQAEWRVIASRFLDMALLYDAGRVADRRSDLTKGPLKSDYGLGFRFHSLVATPLRIELAKSNEGLSIVFSAKAAF